MTQDAGTVPNWTVGSSHPATTGAASSANLQKTAEVAFTQQRHCGTGRRNPRSKQESEGIMTTRWNINITPAERAARILIGGLGAVAGIVLLTGATSVLAVVLEVLFVVAGLDLVVTGALGHCPLYAKLGHVPASLNGGPS